MRRLRRNSGPGPWALRRSRLLTGERIQWHTPANTWVRESILVNSSDKNPEAVAVSRADKSKSTKFWRLPRVVIFDCCFSGRALVKDFNAKHFTPVGEMCTLMEGKPVYPDAFPKESYILLI